MLRNCGRLTVAILALLTLGSLSQAAWAQQKGGKGGKGGGGSSGAAPPVNYTLSTIAVEGLQESFDTNDFGLALCGVLTAEVSTPINTDSDRAIALVDIHTGEAAYVENMLTEPTIWTECPAGVDSVSVVAIKINNLGTIIASARPVINGEPQYPVAYLLHRVLVTTPEGEEVVRYRPENLGIGGIHFINDLNWIVGQDFTGYYVRKADGTRIYLDTIGLPYSVGGSFDLNNVGQYHGETINTANGDTRKYLFDVMMNKVTYYDDRLYSSGQGTTLNDHGVIAGEYFVYYQYTKRGKTETGIRRVPAVLDPVSGLQLFDDSNNGEVQDRVVYINHQRKDNQSTLLAYTPKPMSGETLWNAVRDLWLKRPNSAGFHLYDAMDDGSKLLWSTLAINYDHVQILTPRAGDLTVNHDVAPIICGTSFNRPNQLWVCKPAP